jgi:hypothetical protein
VAVFKRRGLGNAPGLIYMEDVTLPPGGHDIEVDAQNQHGTKRLITSAPAWVGGAIRMVTTWR